MESVMDLARKKLLSATNEFLESMNIPHNIQYDWTTMGSNNSIATTNCSLQAIDNRPHIVPECHNCVILSAQCSILEAKNELLQERLETITALVNTSLNIYQNQTQYEVVPTSDLQGQENEIIENVSEEVIIESPTNDTDQDHDVNIAVTDPYSNIDHAAYSDISSESLVSDSDTDVGELPFSKAEGAPFYLFDGLKLEKDTPVSQ